jgi:hypothetical protein
MTDRSLSVVTYLVLHHTADPTTNKDILEIAREEQASQGFTTVGYHAVIWADGTTQFGRPIGKVPAANLGLNTVSYAIAWEGNFEPGSPGYIGQKPTDAQITGFIFLAKNVKTKLPNLKWLIGHRDVARIVADPGDATACPGVDAYTILPRLRAATGLASR